MKRILPFILTAVLLTSCSKTPSPERTVIDEPNPVFQDNSPADDGYGVLTKAEEAKLGRVNQLAFSLMNHAEEIKPGSTYVFSPLSVAYVLGMLYEGAAGSTKDEICSTLGFGVSGNDDVSSFLKSLTAKLDRSLSSHQEDSYAREGLRINEEAESPLKTANIIIADNDYPFKDSYRAKVMDCYSAMVENLEFKIEDSAKKVNEWASEHTDGRIKKVIENIYGQACCLNAMSFNAKWKQVDPFNVRDDYFLGYEGQRTEQMLYDRLCGVYYYKGDNYGLVEIPLKDNRNYIADNYRFVILLPDKGYRLSDINVSESMWNEATSSTTPVLADLVFPKFETSFGDFEKRMAELLATSGITTVFTDKCDFSFMSDAEVMITDFKHLANISVNEYGVTAAAVSYTSWGCGHPLPDIVFHANTPFVFAVTEKTTGAILFLGCYR